MGDFLLFAPAVLAGVSFIYMSLCLIAVARFRTRISRRAPSSFQPAITVLKPLCGMEHDLAANLRSFCQQDYDTFQIIFGIRDHTDPAIPVIEGIIAEFPDHDLSLVIDDTVIGSNYKVSNLANMFETARHDIIVVADSDMRVGPDYLQAVAAPFADPRVGAATCVYSGRAGRAGLASKLGAMFVNDWFLPSALIPAQFGQLTYCFGATMAIRRANLIDFGSFGALANILADDYMFGRFVHEQGDRIALVPYIVENVIDEANIPALFSHELRWARTIRSVEPLGYALSSVTEIIALTALAAVCLYAATGIAWVSGVLFASALALRLALHMLISSTIPTRGRATPWLVPLRDVLSPVVRLVSFCGRTVIWREREFVIHADVRLKPAE